MLNSENIPDNKKTLIQRDPWGKSSIDKINLRQFLKLSINTAAALHEIHTNGNVFLSVRPSSIKIDQTTFSTQLIKCDKLIKKGKLIDTSDPDNPIFIDLHDKDCMQLMLPFISPEQTGRVGWPLDLRCDLYSLGVVLYYWGTGVYPFRADNPMDYFYCHIAVDPPAPDIQNSYIPVQLSKIILKLIRKSPEERYQSTLGLKKDLEKSLELLNSAGEIKEFPLGESDFSFTFNVKKKFYGREDQLDTLLHNFNRVKQGEGRTIIIGGYSGSGKTSLVNEFLRVNCNQFDTNFAPMCISGKFDSMGMNKPYHGFIMALQQMAQQTLAHGRQLHDYWEKHLKTGLTKHGQTIIDMVSEFKPLMEKNPSVQPTLNPRDAQTQFLLDFSSFLENICRPEHPVILFIDDLQWSDPASIYLLQMLKKEPIPWFFTICTYRNNEVTSTHPLYSSIQKFNKGLEKITLGSLAVKDITQMVVDSAIKMNKLQASCLAKIVVQKTGGNPFFAINFLNRIQKNRLLVFDVKKAVWQCEIEEIEACHVTDNVADQIRDQIFNLTGAQKSLLNIASCMAGEIDHSLLSRVLQSSTEEIISGLRFLADNNFLLFEKGRWYFSHDKIKETIYSLMGEERRRQIHYDLGKMLLSIKSENVFEIVRHMNNCIDLISSTATKIQLASLNLRAGKISKSRVAFDSAFEFSQKGLDLLPLDAWTSQTKLTLALNFLSGETGYYAKNMRTADKSLNEIKEYALDISDRVNAYKITMANLITSGDHQQAFTCGLEALSMLGMTLPEKIAPWMIAKEFLLLKFYLVGKQPEDLLDLPKLSDPKKIMSIGILSELFQALSNFHDAPEYIFYLVLKIINMTLKYGETNLSGYAYAVYGAVLCQNPRKTDIGYRFGRVALKIHEKPDTIKTKAKTYMFYGGMINHWKNHMRTDSPFLLEAHRVGMENGNDHLFSLLAVVVYLTQLLASGKPILKIIAEHEKYEDVFKRINLANALDMYNMSYQGLLNLSGEEDDPLILKGEWFDETNDSDRSWQETDKNLIWFHFLKLFIEYLLYDFQKAVESSKAGIKLLKNAGGMLLNSHYPFLQSLAMLALMPGLDNKSQKYYLAQVKKNQKNLKIMAKQSPDNFFNMYTLVQAELTGLKGQTDKASILYDQAIESAKKNGFLHMEGVANECAAKFFLNRNQKTIAAGYMIEAYNCFKKWGAKSKQKHLKRLYPDLLAQFNTIEIIREPDLVSVIKASRTIAENSDIQIVVEELMEIVIKNAGARQGFLILLEKGQPVVKAKVVAGGRPQSGFIPVTLNECRDLPATVVNYVIHSKKKIILSDAENQGLFTRDEYIKQKKIKSILCIPMIHEKQITGAFYLENRMTSHVFTKQRIDILTMVTDILINVWARRKAQNKLADYQEQLRALSSQIALTEEEQRRLIALGLHDQTGQSLTLTRMNLNEITNCVSSKEIKKKLEYTTRIVDETIDQVRNLTFDLSPPELYQFGVETAIDSLCERKSKLHNIKILFYDDEKLKPLQKTDSILIYQSVRELLFNVIKHAHATKIHVSVKSFHNRLEVIIKDNGVGFDTANLYLSKQKNNSFGLFSIKERMQYHGGSFHIESIPGRGTKSTLSIPLKVQVTTL